MKKLFVSKVVCLLTLVLIRCYTKAKKPSKINTITTKYGIISASKT